MAENIVEINDGNFENEVVKSNKPAIVDFWAPWCGPCRAIAPFMEELSREYVDKIKFAKMNVDDNPKTPGRFGIRSIPTLIIFKNGKAHSQQIGAVSKSSLEEFIKKAL